MGNEQNCNIEYLFKLIRSVMLGYKAPEPDEGIDWQVLYKLAIKHSIANIIAYAIDTLEKKPEDKIVKLFENYRNLIVVQEVQQDIEVRTLIEKFEDAHIKNMPLKGCVIKKLYPISDMRSMCDIDILIEEGKMDEAEQVMKELSYPIREVGAREVVYKRPPFISVELHRAFVSEKYQKVVFDYYKNIWNMVNPVDGKKYTYTLSNEDFYVYMIVHIVKHYMFGGAGIRNLIDIYVFMNKYKDSLDFEYIDTEFKKLGIYTFAENVLMLTDELFNGKEKSKIGIRMIQYILNGGTYGSKMYNDASYALQNEQKSAKAALVKKIIYAVFLPYENMCILYPKLKTRKALLPIYWIIRGCDKLLHNKNDIKQNLTSKATNDDILQLKKHFEEVGINLK